VFTVAGFGTVVTGTLIDGALSLGQEVEIVPALAGGHLTALRSRVRGLQTHRSRVEQARPGTRTAANLAGLEPDALWRGQVVTTPGWLRPSEAVDVRLRALPANGRALRHNLNVTFHSLAAESPARLRLLETDQLRPGDETWAQLRLFKPLALLKGDRFVIRDANDTLGGGVVVETQAKRHPRNRLSVIESLERQEGGGPEEAVYAAVAASEPAEVKVALSRLDVDTGTAEKALARLGEAGRVVVLGRGEERFAYTSTGFEKLRLRVVSTVEAYLKANPLHRGLRTEELRSRLGMPPRLFALALQELVARGELQDAGSRVATPGWTPALSADQQRRADAYLAALRASPFSPPTEERPPENLLAYLVESGAVVDAGEGVVFAAEAFEEMTRRVVEALKQRETVTMGEVRDMLGSSRRYVQHFLEELDRRRVTIRRGDERLLRNDPFAK